MTFSETILATLIGASVGAVLGAFAAWLFSLDLRRRERDERMGEREQERLDRLAQREQDRLDRVAEREEEREFRKSERELDRRVSYEAEMLRLWPRVAAELSDFANANRAIVERAPALVGAEEVERYRRSVVSLMHCLQEVATVAKGSDHEVVNNLGVLVAVLPPHQRGTVEAVERIRILLSTYFTAAPEHREVNKDRLRSELAALARGESKS